YGAFSPDRYADAEHLVLIAGGVGIAPMMSILRTMVDRGDTRPVTLLYGSRDWDNIAYREELAELEQRLKLRVVHVLERAPEGWQGETGFVTDQVLARHLPAAVDYHVFLCGPLGMLNAVEAALAKLNVPETRIHLERFDL
ncbi:MAG: oxidoreductase, partial [Chloroflexi bacterium]|nr:oxidoreductase [Chloroflexota bacterium]